MTNPFEKGKMGFGLRLPTANPDQGKNAGGNLDVFKAAEITNKKEAAANKPPTNPTDVNFPKHLYIPAGAQSLDLRRVINVPTATVDFELFRFVAPPGATTRFINYGIFNDGDNGAFYNFVPLVDGSRVFPYHGDPSQNFKIYLGLGPDLSQTAMIPCQLTLQPGQVLQWLITNTSGVDTSMGVRMLGYFDTTHTRVQGRFGG